MANNLDQTIKIAKEYKLLVLCARTRLNQEVKDRIIQLLHEDISWEYLIEISTQHKLNPLIYWNLSIIDSDLIDLDIMDQLKSLYNRTIQRNLLYLGELFNILEILNSQNINAVPYKGPVLAITSYKDISLREFVDIDIFVNKNNIPKLKTILISRGYKPQIQLKGLQEKIYLNSQRDYQFNNPQNNTNIEIHWNFIGLSFTYPTDNFSNPKNLKHIQIHNRDVLSLANEDMLLILCIHASGHLWERLSWICDISEFIQSNEDINWEDLIRKK